MVKVNPPNIPLPLIYPVNNRVTGQNKICTSHYNPWTFVFVNLFEQFHRGANIFFLFCAILQAIPVISPLDPVMGFLGLIFMLTISMVKAGYEDYRRHKADNEINNKTVTLWRSSGIHEQIKWIDVQPGDVLIIEDDSEFPADCVILDASSVDNRCRILTAALDGETDLKYKRNVANDIDIKNSCFILEMSTPSPSLQSFSGCITMSNSTKYILSLDNFVPRGCVLKKTKSVSALVLYTGENTKIILNSAKPHYKYTEIDRFLTFFVVFSIIILFGFSILFTILSYFYSRRNMKQGYLQLEKMSKIFYFCNVFSWVLVLNGFIPLSLYSSLDIVRFFLSLFISFDKELAEKDGRKSVCRNSDLVYSIGRITHVLSDKTGTLTKNLMTFRIACFQNIALGLGSIIDEDDDDNNNNGEEYSGNTHDLISNEYSLSYNSNEDTKSEELQFDPEKLFLFSDEDFQYIKDNVYNDNDILFFIYIVLFCNSAMTSVNSTYYTIDEIHSQFPDFEFTYDLPPPEIVAKFPYSITYLTSSPDELCLIHIARECGFILYDITENSVKVIIDGELKIFERPISFEFTSKRKRGSCITKIDDKYYMLMKGADVIISQLVTNPDSSLFGHVQNVSECGLRTLVYAIKEIDNIDNLIQRYVQIKLQTSDQESEMEKLSNECENNLCAIAVTGVEDELQDEVGLTLRRLRMANIKTWMLTGDKLSTALNIGKTTELISPNDDIVILNFDDSKNHFEKLKEIDYSKTIVALEGATFASYLNYENVIKEFFSYAAKCSGLIMARSEPSQKGNVVRSFKNFDKKNSILAIGDGANDVDMIRAADVGIGVEGKEGSEAVMSSDFSLPSFHHLSTLLIVHGVWCVNRVKLLVGLTLYKTAIIGILQIIYGFFNGYSATSTFDSAYLSVYNLLLTIPQLFFVTVSERHLSSRYALAVPHIYKESQKDGGLNALGLLEYYILAILHSVMIFFFSYYENNNVILNKHGTTFDYALFTQISGWALLFVFTVTLLTRFRTISILHVILYILCILIYMLVEFVYSYFNKMFYAVVPILFSTPRIWFTIPICVGACLIIDLMVTYIRNLFWPSLSNAVAELEYAEENGVDFFF